MKIQHNNKSVKKTIQNSVYSRFVKSQSQFTASINRFRPSSILGVMTSYCFNKDIY